MTNFQGRRPAKKSFREWLLNLCGYEIWPPTHSDPTIKGLPPRIISKRQADAMRAMGEASCDAGISNCWHLSEDDHIFNGFIKQHEKRVLAFLVEEEARRRSLDRDDVIALRARFGTELVRPEYDAQDQLGKCGIGPSAVTRLQRSWIVRNGGDPNAHPATREVERIIFGRNKDKAVSICGGA